LVQICTKSFVGWGFAPDHTGELTALPRPLAGLRDRLLREGRGREGEGSGGEGREEREGEEGRGGTAQILKLG